MTAAPFIRTFIGLMIATALILAHPAESCGAESIFGFSFKDVMAPLSATDKSVQTGKVTVSHGDYAVSTLPAQDAANKITDSAWNEIDYKHFRLSFKTMLAEPGLDRNYHRLTPESSPDIGQMFPLIFQGSYRDSLQTLGRMIEPQIRIEIRF
jgi:hypothetical protein